MASSAACSASAPLWRRAATSAKSCWFPKARTAPIPATAAFAGYRVENIPANAAGRVDLEALKSRLGPDVAAVMITNPNTCGLFEPDMIAISRSGPCGGRVRLLRRRQLQRDRRQGPSRRPRHRRDAHQPAQDLLDAAWRRRAGIGTGGAVGSARALRAAALRREDAGRQLQAGRGGECRRRASQRLRPDGRVPRPDGHVYAGARLHPQSRRGRAEAGRRGFGAQRQLHPAQPRGRARRAVRQVAVRACTRRSSPTAALPAG